MVNTLGVVPQKPEHELFVEGFGIKEKPMPEVCELFLNGAVEALHMGVHFGCLRVGVVVRDLKISKMRIEVLFEFGAVVGENECGWIREYLLPSFEELLCSLRSMRCSTPCEGKA